LTSQSFDRIPEPLRAALERQGFETLTAVQEAVLSSADEVRDLQISSQTGSGKTVALGMVAAATLFELPDDLRGPVVLVIVPTRELAAQVKTELDWLYADVRGVNIQCVTGGTPVMLERKRLKRAPRVLVGTPGRLLDHLRSGALSLADVKQLVLDEADQMLDMGFREELEAILDETPAERRTHLVSATFPDGIQRLAARYQRDPVHIEGTRLGEANADIEHVAYRVREGDRYAALVNLLLAHGEGRTLVFVDTRAETSLLAEKLTGAGFSAAPLSGELVQAQRTRTLAAFKNGQIAILVATDVAARGLDVPDVATVVHTSPCLDAEVYTHRSGRTGRAGRKGRSLSLVSPRKERRLHALLRSSGVPVEWRDVPTAAQVQKLVKKRERRALYEALAAAPEPSAEQLAQASKLLEGRTPEAVVAALVDMRRGTDGPAAQELGSTPPAAAYEGRRETRSYQRDGGSFKKNGFKPGGGFKRENGFKPGGRSFKDGAGSTRFHINWGFDGGANPKRLLAHICRRGGIEGRHVGAIRIQPQGSTFEVQGQVASEFETRARKRDNRDPHLRIQRAFKKPPFKGRAHV